MGTLARIAFVCWVVCGAIWGQAVSTSQITGTVQDSSGSAVPGAVVKATQTATGAARTVTTGADGGYVLTNLPVGPYQLEVTKEGFTKYVQSGIVLQVASNPTIDAILKVGAVTEQVNVQADATMVETHSSGIGAVVDNQRILEMPLNGRDPASLVFLAGAAVVGANVDSVANGKNYPVQIISVAGGTSDGTSYLLDGGTFNDPANNLTLPLPFPDALQEFKVETSALAAQYGHHSAAAVNAVSKSGTNEFHGDLFEFVRNGYFNARNFFAASTDVLKRNQFGGTVGGPIRKNKLFFFLGYQDTIQRSNPINQTVIIPTAAMAQGDFRVIQSAACNGGTARAALRAPFGTGGFAPNTMNPALIPTAVKNLLKLYPAPLDDCGHIGFGVPDNYDEPQGLAKVDYQLSEKQSLFARYYAIHRLAPARDATANILDSPNNGIEAFVQSLVIGHTWVINPTTISSFHITGDRNFTQRVTTSAFTGATLGIPIYNVPPPYPLSLPIAITGGASIFGVGGNFITNPTDTYQFAEDVSLVRGAHQIGFGVDFIRSMMNLLTNRLANGMYTINGQTTGLGYGDLLADAASQYQQANASEFQPRQKYIGMYVQDAWKVSSRLTINAGLRWEPLLQIPTKPGFLSIFQLDWFKANVHSTTWTKAPAGLLFPGDKLPDGSDFPSGAAKSRWNDFAPRLGMVWDPKGDGRMTVRAAYGMFYDLPNIFWNNNISFATPWGSAITLTNVPFSNPYKNVAGGNPFPVAISKNMNFLANGALINDKLDHRAPYLQQWNLTLQKQMGTSWLLSAGYLGNEMVHMWTTYDLNPAIFAPGASTANTAARRLLNQLNPSQGSFYSNINTNDDGGTQSYNAMLLSIQRRLSKGFTLLANYTLSHCIGVPQNYELTGVTYVESGNRNAARGNCLNVDRRHIVNISGVAEAPKFSNRIMRLVASDWKLSVIASAQSGTYSTITTGADNALNGQTGQDGQRPNLILSSAYPSTQTLTRWINPPAFQAPSPGTFGNLGASNIEGPGALNINLALTRSFRLGEARRVELRGEAFNVINRANFGAPVLTMTSSQFGQITSATDPRILQLALKLYF